MASATEFTAREYDLIREGAQASAVAMVPALINEYEPRTVLDVGCGEGWFAAEFEKHGVQARGIEYRIPTEAALGVPILELDLSQDGSLRGLLQHDLVLCLEVAEHLPPERAAGFVEELCGLSRVVVFSAAVPGQTGHGHINCRWPSYWKQLFERHGMWADGSLRELLWYDKQIEPWYRQNLIVFSPYKVRSEVYDIVHPEIFSWFAPARGKNWDQ